MNPNICLSGGAEGADLMWGMTAGLLGHQVIHFSFNKHRSRAPDSEIVILNDEQLETADPFLEKANETLKRHIPYTKPWIINLLRRNYFQVADTERLYAVSSLNNAGGVEGGSAWAVQMALDIHGPSLEAYLFDQRKDKWYSYNNGWNPCSFVPQPFGIWTGIGSRKLLPTGREAIRTIMDYVPKRNGQLSPSVSHHEN